MKYIGAFLFLVGISLLIDTCQQQAAVLATSHLHEAPALPPWRFRVGAGWGCMVTGLSAFIIVLRRESLRRRARATTTTTTE